MPSVMDAPEVVEYEEFDLQEAQPQVRTTPHGFWQRVKQYVRRHSVHASSHTPSSSHASLHRIESPMARLAQEYPTLYLLGFCGIHSG